MDVDLRAAVAAAAASGDAAQLDALLGGATGADDAQRAANAPSVHVPDDGGGPCDLTPLAVAALGAHAAAVAVLLGFGASPSASDQQGRTAAHEAAAAADPTAACLRLLCNADTGAPVLRAKAKGGVQPIHVAAEAGRVSALRLLAEALEADDHEGCSALAVPVKGGWTAAHFA